MPQTGQPRRRLLRISGNIALIASLLICGAMSCAVAYGWLLHADHYGAPFAAYGRWMLGLTGCMALAAVLYLCRLDLPAAILGTASYIPILWITVHAISIAERAGWAGQTEASFGRTAAAVWRNGLLWNALPFLLLMLLSLTRQFSDDATVRRKTRRAAKTAAENVSAPSILGDDSIQPPPNP